MNHNQVHPERSLGYYTSVTVMYAGICLPSLYPAATDCWVERQWVPPSRALVYPRQIMSPSLPFHSRPVDWYSRVSGHPSCRLANHASIVFSLALGIVQDKNYDSSKVWIQWKGGFKSLRRSRSYFSLNFQPWLITTKSSSHVVSLAVEHWRSTWPLCHSPDFPNCRKLLHAVHQNIPSVPIVIRYQPIKL